jgi:hypothetical protein
MEFVQKKQIVVDGHNITRCRQKVNGKMVTYYLDSAGRRYENLLALITALSTK